MDDMERWCNLDYWDEQCALQEQDITFRHNKKEYQGLIYSTIEVRNSVTNKIVRPGYYWAAWFHGEKIWCNKVLPYHTREAAILAIKIAYIEIQSGNKRYHIGIGN